MHCLSWTHFIFRDDRLRDHHDLMVNQYSTEERHDNSLGASPARLLTPLGLVYVLAPGIYSVTSVALRCMRGPFGFLSTITTTSLPRSVENID